MVSTSLAILHFLPQRLPPQMTPVGFEPTQLALVELETTPLDHSGKVSLPIDEGIHHQENPYQESVRQQKAPKNNAWHVPTPAPRNIRPAFDAKRHLWDSNPRGETPSA
jgi:hypothetical protein